MPGVADPYDDADIYTHYLDGTSSSRGRCEERGRRLLPDNADIDALYCVDDDTFYVSFNLNGGTVVDGLTVQDEDVVLYDTGTWSLYFDG